MTYPEVSREQPRLADLTVALGASDAKRHLIFGAFLVGLAANIGVALSLRNNFPFEDSVNHLTRWVLMAHAWTGHGAPYVRLHAIPSPYLGLDLVGAALATVLSPEMTLRVTAVLMVTAIPIGFYLLLRAVNRENTGWALVGVLVGFGFFAHVGFMNYAIGIGIALAWLAAWWPYRAALSPARFAGLSMGIIVAYLFHLSAPLIVLVVIWLDMLLNWRDRRWKGVVGITAVLVAFFLLQAALTPIVAPGTHTFSRFGTPWSKIRNLLTPFYVFGYGQAIVATATYLLALGLFLRTNPRPSLKTTWGLSVLAFLGLYFVFPANLPGVAYLDMRWLVPAMLLPFVLAGREAKAPGLGAVTALLVACLINTATLARSDHAIDRQLDDYAAALNQIPPAKKVLPLIADHMRWGPRVLPYRHFAFWYQIERDGREPGLFGWPRESFMPYFEETGGLYDPQGWDGGPVERREPLDWERILAQYDYVIVAGPDPRVRQEVSAHTQVAYSVGEISVYAVLRPPSPGA
ncbi:MAG TPA: hypothetical protein VK733_04425 [Gemmatimonadaceae bacterium]|nr:hypothetical protein [Gemmatimonadaceae bacterium]